jgi:hypothetical protein
VRGAGGGNNDNQTDARLRQPQLAKTTARCPFVFWAFLCSGFSFPQRLCTASPVKPLRKWATPTPRKIREKGALHRNKGRREQTSETRGVDNLSQLGVAMEGVVQIRSFERLNNFGPAYCVLTAIEICPLGVAGGDLLIYSNVKDCKAKQRPNAKAQVEAVRDWDGKGSFRTYKHGVIIEYASGKKMQMLAPSFEAKKKWLAVNEHLVVARVAMKKLRNKVITLQECAQLIEADFMAAWPTREEHTATGGADQDTKPDVVHLTEVHKGRADAFELSIVDMSGTNVAKIWAHPAMTGREVKSAIEQLASVPAIMTQLYNSAEASEIFNRDPLSDHGVPSQTTELQVMYASQESMELWSSQCSAVGSMEHDYQMKILLIGGLCGKSSLLERFAGDGTFHENKPGTVGIDFKIKRGTCTLTMYTHCTLTAHSLCTLTAHSTVHSLYSLTAHSLYTLQHSVRVWGERQTTDMGEWAPSVVSEWAPSAASGDSVLDPYMRSRSIHCLACSGLL